MLPTISDYKPTTVFLSQEFELEFSPKTSVAGDILMFDKCLKCALFVRKSGSL